MCGFVGFLDGKQRLPDPRGVLRRASARIARRGPDGEGLWSEGSLHLAHRRLAVVDLTDSGRQPMVSACGRYVLVFNGEIYNHADLRRAPRLRAIAWRGHSDTEVLLEHLAQYGVDATLRAARGMFALALWDRAERSLTLSRDRLGEKPLFYGWLSGVFVFGSDLNVLSAFPERPALHAEAVALYCRYGYIPAPLTLYQGLRKVLPGTWVTLSESQVHQQEVPRPMTYWSLDQARQDGEQRFGALTTEQRIAELETLLSQSLREQLIADVPVGALLSGGIDSSLVAALAQAQSDRPLKTFTIGFREPAYDEAPYARAIARHLGTDHQELYIDEAEVRGLVESLGEVIDEPFADASLLPTLLVSHLVRQHVTVCLSGDGGDELFRGYERYLRGRRLWQSLHSVPQALRAVGAEALSAVPVPWLDALLGPLRRRGITGDRLHKAAQFLAAGTPEVFYNGLSELPGGAQLLVPTALGPGLGVPPPESGAFTDYASAWDCRYYLPDDILTKVDRAAMHASLETRVPLLHPDIVALAQSTPEEDHLKGATGKHLLRALLARHVPPTLYERPKQGFGVPMGDWLRGPLKDWAACQLDVLAQRTPPGVNPEAIRRMWQAHQSRQRNWSSALWAACVLGAFLGRT